MRNIVIVKIDNVQPRDLGSDGTYEIVDSEDKGAFTGIECTVVNEDNELDSLVLILPRGRYGMEPCENTFLLADAIRED